MSRAIRRFNMEKKKQKIKKFLENRPFKNFTNINKTIGRLAHTHTPCSCSMCGNPRKHFGEKTRQEIISELELEEGVQDYFEQRLYSSNLNKYYKYYWFRHGFDFFFEEDDFEEEYYIRWFIDDDIWDEFVCD